MKKIIIRYILMYMPMVLGIVLYRIGVVNIISSLLLFVGGYNAIKNTFDYRLIRKNKNIIINDDSNNLVKRKDCSGNGFIIKKRKRNIKVRKREKD